MWIIVASFVFFLALFTVVGIWSARVRSDTTEDYLLAGRDVPPWLTAMSSVATNNSGFMFIGLLGFTYRFGVQAVWLQGGWLLGDYIAWRFIHPRIRQASETDSANSVSGLLAGDGKGGVNRVVAGLAGLLTILFLGGYAAAQLKAGATTLEVLFGWEAWVGAVLGAVIVVLYCFSGGLRASIWTDAAQAIVMLVSMVILLGMAWMEAGDPVALLSKLEAIDPALVAWFPDGLAFGFGLYLLGFVAAGVGAVGQPHIVVRTMALDSPESIPATRRLYFVWFIPFSIAAVAAGLYGRVLLPELTAGADPSQLAQAAETALPELAMLLLPNALIGLMLAGVFSATMSTADSQLLSCSASISQDLVPAWQDSYMLGKVTTLTVTAFALGIALWAGDGVFDLVLIAWSALGATIGPVLVLRVFGKSPPWGISVMMMTGGLATVVLWGNSEYAGSVFKLLPGIIVPFVIYFVYTGAMQLLAKAGHGDEER